jgi:hypothetical protein
MRIRKSVAGIGAFGLVVAGFAVATAPAAQAASGGPYTLSGAPFNAAGAAGYGGTPSVDLTAVQVPGTGNITITADISVGPTTTSFAGFDENAYRLDAYVRIDDGPQVQLTGVVGDVDVPPSTVSYPSGTTATATVPVGNGAHTIVLQSLVVDSNGPSSGGGFATQFTELAGFDAAYNLSTITYDFTQVPPVADVSGVLGNPPTGPIGLTETITVAGPSASIVSSSNQISGVTGYVRGGTGVTATLSGAAWPFDQAVGDFTAQFCDATGTTCEAAVTNTLSTDGSGGLSGTISIPAATAAGLRALKLTNGSSESLTSVTVLGTPAITISPANGGPGTIVNWSASNYNPLGFGVAHASIPNPNGFCNVPDGPIGGPPCNDPAGNFAVGPYIPGTQNTVVGWTATATGTGSGSVVVTDPETIQIQVSEKNIVAGAPVNTNLDMTGLATGTSKALPFAVNQDQCDATDGACNTKQNVEATVLAGRLTQQAASDGDRVRVLSDGGVGEADTYTDLATSSAAQENTQTGDPTAGSGMTVDIERDATGEIVSVTIADIGDGLYNSNDLVVVDAGDTGTDSTQVVIEVLRSTSTLIPFGSVVSSTAIQTLPASLNNVTVTDARGGIEGWSLTASLPSLTSGTASISNEFVRIEEISCAPQGSSAPGVAEGTDGNFSAANTPAASYPASTGTITLCNKLTGTGNVANGGSTSGEYVVDAELFLDVPAFQKIGNYNATMTITLA